MEITLYPLNQLHNLCSEHIHHLWKFPPVLLVLLLLLLLLLLWVRVSGGASGKEPTCQCRRHKRHRFDPWVGKITWRRKWLPTVVFLPGEFYGQKSLVSYTPQGRKNSHNWSNLACTHACDSHNHVLLAFWLAAPGHYFKEGMSYVHFLRHGAILHLIKIV